MKSILCFELKRCFGSKRLYLSLLTGIVISLLHIIFGVLPLTQWLSSWQGDFFLTPHSAYGHWIGMDSSTVWPTLLYMLLPFLCAFPFSDTVSWDFNTGYVMQIFVRRKKSTYLFAKALTIFIASAFLTATILFFDFAGTALYLPLVRPEALTNLYGISNRSLMAHLFYHMRVICGLVLPTMGTVSIDGEIIGKGISFPRSIGLLLENPIFIDEFTGAKNLSLLCDIKRLVSQAQIGDTLRRVGLNPSDKRPFRKYSLGMKQRLGIAAAIVESPDLILLDEPFNALDESGIKEIRDLLRELRQKGKLIVLTCHDRQQMESLADEIIAMREGRIVNVDKNCHEEV